MAEQLTFDLPAKSALGRESFLVTPSNALAVAQIERWQDWPGGRMVLCGPAGAGKTHLAHVFAGDSGAPVVNATEVAALGADTLSENACLVVENADQVAGDAEAEAALFHLYNLMQAAGHTLLLTAVGPPARWPLDLPDLRSRLQSISVVTLEPPCDTLLAAMLLKQFSDRQITVAPDLIAYLLNRMERSASAVQQVVAALDRAALEQKRPVTRRLAAAVLDKP